MTPTTSKEYRHSHLCQLGTGFKLLNSWFGFQTPLKSWNLKAHRFLEQEAAAPLFHMYEDLGVSPHLLQGDNPQVLPFPQCLSSPSRALLDFVSLADVTMFAQAGFTHCGCMSTDHLEFNPWALFRTWKQPGYWGCLRWELLGCTMDPAPIKHPQHQNGHFTHWRTPLKQGRAEIWRSGNIRSENFLCLDLEIRLFSLQLIRPGIFPANPFRETCEREALKKEGVFSGLPNLLFVLKWGGYFLSTVWHALPAIKASCEVVSHIP